MTVRVLFADDLAGMQEVCVRALGPRADVVPLAPPPRPETSPPAPSPAPDVIVGSTRDSLLDAGARWPTAARVGLVASLGEGSVPAWPPGSADRILAPFTAVLDALVAAGWPEEAVLETGLPVAPDLAPAADPAASRNAAGVDEGPILAVRPSAVEAWGLGPLLVQMGLLSSDPFCLFDVGLDAGLAEKLRDLVPVHDLRAAIFSEGAHSMLALADAVVCAGTLPEVAEALAVGAPAVVVEPDAPELWSIPHEAGAVVVVTRQGRFAVDVDSLLQDERLASAREAARRFGRPGASKVVADAILAAAADAPALVSKRGRPAGLPSGVEILGRRGRRTPPTTSDEDVERELEALRERMQQEPE